MKILTYGVTLAALSLGAAACGGYDEGNQAYGNEGYENQGAAAYGEGEGDNYQSGAAAATAWPEGARIVVEEGVTYRIDPEGSRVRLGPEESRIIVEDGVRFRVDPDGNRIRIDERGAVIDVDVDENEAEQR
jgi:hypothetical protein